MSTIVIFKNASNYIFQKTTNHNFIFLATISSKTVNSLISKMLALKFQKKEEEDNNHTFLNCWQFYCSKMLAIIISKNVHIKGFMADVHVRGFMVAKKL